MELPEIVYYLVRTRIEDLTDRIDPLNGENDQELIEATAQEILELDNFLEYWLTRSNTKELKYFWHPRKYDQSLLMSFESYAAKKASGSYTPIARATPNSLRDVEPGVEYVCKEKIQTDSHDQTK